MDKSETHRNPGMKQGKKSRKPQFPKGEKRKISENQYRFLINSVKDGILILDYETEKIIDANLSITELTGFPIETVRGKEIWDLNLFTDRKHYESTIKEIKNNGQTYVKEIPVVKKNGGPTNLEFVSNIYTEGDHKIIQCNIRSIETHGQDISRINEMRFHQISEGTRELIWEVDMNGVFTYVNSKARDILGYEPKEIIGKKHFYDFYDPAKKEILKKQIFEIFSRGEPIKNFINCNIDKAGNKICFSTNGFPILDFKKNLTGYRGVDTDITVQLKTEEALRQSEAKTRTILEAISTGIIIVDPETHTIVDINAEAAKLFGEQKEKIIGNICHNYICPAEKGKCPATDLGQLIDNSERLLINAKGEEIPILKTVTQIEIAGKKYLLENFTDISMRKQAEENLQWEKERYKAITNAIPDLVFRLDKKGRYLDYKADENELAVQTGDIIGKTNRELMPAEFADLVEEKIKKALKTKKTQHFEYQMPVPGKGIRSYDARMVVSGKDEVITFVRDITEQKQSEKEIQKSEHRYRELFDNSATPIWEADLSNLIHYLTELKENGITDLRKYFDENFDEAVHCVSMARLLDANKELINFLKADSKEQALTGLLDFFIEESFEPAIKVILELAEGKLKIDGEIPIKTLTNETKHVIFRMAVAPKGNHTWAKSLINFIDITEKKEAEKALRESEEHLHQIMENVDSVFYMMSYDSQKLIYVNSAYEKIWGQSIEEIMKDPLKWVDPIYEEDRGTATQLFSKGEGEVQYRIVLPDGTIRWIWDRMFPIRNEKGEITFLCGMASDVTESKNTEQTLRESEAKLEEATKIARLATWEYDNISKKFTFNDQFYTLLRTTAEQEGGYQMSGKRYLEKFVHPEDIEILSREAKKAVKTDDPKYSSKFDHRILYEDGKIGYITVNVRIEKDPTGRTIRIYGIKQDITERIQAEESLKLFRTLIDKSNDAIEVIDIKTGRYLDVNKKACSDLGYTREELLSMKVFDVDPNQNQETFNNMLKEFSQSQSNLIETTHVKKDGSVFPVEVNVTIVELEKTYAIAIVRDITERKLVEKELAESEERYRLLFQSAAEGIILVETETMKIKLANAAMCNMFGYTQEEMLQLKITDIHPKESTDFVITDFNLHAKGKKNNTADIQCQRKDGTIFFANIYETNIYIEGSKHNIGFFTDITEQKEANRKVKMFRTLLDHSMDPIELLDMETGYFVDCNEKAYQELGYTRKEFLSLKWYQVDTALTKESYQERLRLIKKSESMLTEGIHRRKDGTKFPVEVNANYVKLDREYIVAIVRNITQRKQDEQELINAKTKAEESDRLKTAFLANMSHEIRTPMNGILGFTELLKEPMLTGEEQKKYIDIIEKSGTRMLSIINDIISISKIEAGQVEVSVTDTNINDQLEYIYLFFKKEAKEKNLELLLSDFLPKEEAIIKTDREKVYAVLINLVKNAIKFTKEGSINFGCKKKGEFLEFYVKDTGSGVHKEKREVIFDRFRQGSEEMNRDYEGAGLGLAICRGYLEMLGGKIWMYPNLFKDPKTGISYEKGSVFYFTIPMKINDDQEITYDSMQNTEEMKNQSKNLKVLIAEDDEVSLLFINKIAKDFAKEILNASNGIEAVEICKNNPDIDLILMDLKMPMMEGHEAVIKIREFNKDIIIIAQTAYGMVGDREKALNAGCNDYISKPINRNELLELVNKYFE